MNGNVVYEAHPAMFRAHPFWFIGCVVLIPAFGIGILLLLYWYIHTRQTALTVTENELLYERGILSKDRTSVSLKHIRAVHVDPGVPQPHSRRGDDPGLDRRRSATWSSRWRNAASCRSPARSTCQGAMRNLDEAARIAGPAPRLRPTIAWIFAAARRQIADRRRAKIHRAIALEGADAGERCVLVGRGRLTPSGEGFARRETPERSEVQEFR